MCTELTSVAGSSLLLPSPITADIETVISEKEKRLQREERLEELLVSMEREIRQLKEDKEFLSNKSDQVTEGYKKLSGLYQQQWWLLQEEKRKNAALKQEQTKAIDLEKSREDLTKAITLLKADNHTLTNERENAQKSVNELKQELQLLQENHQQFENEHHKEKEEWQKTMRKQEDLMREKNELEVKVKEFEQSWKVTHRDVALSKQELGRGGWGAVRVGVFREQSVAVKQLHEVIVSENNLAVMNREINTMSKLRHPNLLLFIGAVLDHPSKNPLIITEIMDTSLRQAYEKGQLTDKSTKLSVLRDTAAGLNYLHCHPDEIIHRDVSSANVLLESRGPNKWRAKLSDFGSANVAPKAFTQGMGTLVYSAPESIPSSVLDTEKQQLTTKMDVFSYGVLLCEVLTSSFPNADQFQTMLRSVSRSSPPIGQLVQDCINRNPKERPTMKQVIQQIDKQLK